MRTCLPDDKPTSRVPSDLTALPDFVSCSTSEMFACAYQFRIWLFVFFQRPLTQQVNGSTLCPGTEARTERLRAPCRTKVVAPRC